MVSDLWLFLTVPWVCLQFVVVVFPIHTLTLAVSFLLCSDIESMLYRENRSYFYVDKPDARKT